MDGDRRRRAILLAGIALMLVALFTYVVTLDESDPEALPESVEQVEGGME